MTRRPDYEYRKIREFVHYIYTKNYRQMPQIKMSKMKFSSQHGMVGQAYKLSPWEAEA